MVLPQEQRFALTTNAVFLNFFQPSVEQVLVVGVKVEMKLFESPRLFGPYEPHEAEVTITSLVKMHRNLDPFITYPMI